MTKGLCAVCNRTVDAKILFHDGSVYFDKYCPDHGHEKVMVASSVDWYLDALSFIAPSAPPKGELRPVEEGCPNDCGPCKQHQQKTVMPVLPIVSECNLDCPICYTVNKNENAFVLTKEGFAEMLSHLAEDRESIDIINFTGGEPTLHPELPELVRMAHRAGFHRVAISTNGLRLKDRDYLKELAECDTRVVLSLDTFDPEIDKKLLGANTVKRKLEVIDLLEEHDVTTTILPAIASGLNDADVPRLLELVLARPNIVSLELHTLTFTGQGGIGFDRKARTTTPDLHRLIEQATGGKVGPKDFVPSPLAHPHCYSICYLLMLDDGGYVPFTQFMSRATLFGLLSDSLYIQPRERVEEALRDSLDQLWASSAPIDRADSVMKTLRRLLEEMFPSPGISLDARRRIAERSSKAIYIHSHMDAENFDVGRVMRCSIGVPETDGSNVPVCSYNVLYREKDARFTSQEMLERMQLIRPASLTRRDRTVETSR
jgi:uncharacterized radical SAM superfamily Fe-S cluster-containing enzyme